MEQYGNLGQTTLLANYTTGSGVLNVANTAASGFPALAEFRLAVRDPVSKVVRTLFKVTAITDSTHFAVTVEGTDTACNLGDEAVGVETAGALDAIRSDVHQFGLDASLPSTTGQKKGNHYYATDTRKMYYFDGSAWQQELTGGLIGKAFFSASGGTISNLTVSGVISNVTRSSTGHFAVTFTSSQSAYIVTIIANNNGGAQDNFAELDGSDTTPPSSGFNFITAQPGAAFHDPDLCMVGVLK